MEKYFASFIWANIKLITLFCNKIIISLQMVLERYEGCPFPLLSCLSMCDFKNGSNSEISSNIPRKLPLLVTPNNSVSPLNDKPLEIWVIYFSAKIDLFVYRQVRYRQYKNIYFLLPPPQISVYIFW